LIALARGTESVLDGDRVARERMYSGVTKNSPRAAVISAFKRFTGSAGRSRRRPGCKAAGRQTGVA